MKEDFDSEAEREGASICKMNLNGLRKSLRQKDCTKMVNVRVLEKAFDNRYGRNGYVSIQERIKKDED